jgi:hypothetical protein
MAAPCRFVLLLIQTDRAPQRFTVSGLRKSVTAIAPDPNVLTESKTASKRPPDDLVIGNARKALAFLRGLY